MHVCSPLVDGPNLYSHQKAMKVQHQFKSLPVPGLIGLLISAIVLSVYWHLTVVLFCIFIMTNKITQPFMCMGHSDILFCEVPCTIFVLSLLSVIYTS